MFEKEKYYDYIKTLEGILAARYILIFSVVILNIILALLFTDNILYTILYSALSLLIVYIFALLITINIKVKIQKMKLDIDIYYYIKQRNNP